MLVSPLTRWPTPHKRRGEGEGARAATLRMTPRFPAPRRHTARTRVVPRDAMSEALPTRFQRFWATTSRETSAFTVRPHAAVQSACN